MCAVRKGGCVVLPVYQPTQFIQKYHLVWTQAASLMPSQDLRRWSATARSNFVGGISELKELVSQYELDQDKIEDQHLLRHEMEF